MASRNYGTPPSSPRTPDVSTFGPILSLTTAASEAPRGDRVSASRCERLSGWHVSKTEHDGWAFHIPSDGHVVVRIPGTRRDRFVVVDIDPRDDQMIAVRALEFIDAPIRWDYDEHTWVPTTLEPEVPARWKAGWAVAAGITLIGGTWLVGSWTGSVSGPFASGADEQDNDAVWFTETGVVTGTPSPGSDPVGVVERLATGIESQDARLALSTLRDGSLTAQQEEQISSTLPIASETVKSCGAEGITVDPGYRVAAVSLCLAYGAETQTFDITLRCTDEGWLITGGVPLQTMVAGSNGLRVGDLIAPEDGTVTVLPGTYEFQTDDFLRPRSGVVEPFTGSRVVPDPGWS